MIGILHDKSDILFCNKLFRNPVTWLGGFAPVLFLIRPTPLLTTNGIIRKILPLLLCFLWFRAEGQTDLKIPEGYRSRTFTREDGLPYNHVMKIVQDQSGFLWIATWDGLSRYDGYEFKNYFPKPGDSTSVPSFIIHNVLVDHKNNVWVHCGFRPVMQYNRARDNFNKLNGPGSKDSVNRGIGLSSDLKFLGLMYPEEQKIVRYNLDNKEYTTYKVSKKDSDQLLAFWIIDNIEDNTGAQWSIQRTSTGFRILKGTFQNDSTISLEKMDSLLVNVHKPIHPYDTYDFFEIFVSESGLTWLFSNYGIYRMVPGSNLFRKCTDLISPAEFRGKPFCVWSENDTLHLIDPQRNKSLKLSPPEGSSFFAWYIDHSHNIWLGTISESRSNIGLTRLTETPAYFHHYLTGKDENGKQNLVFSVVKDSTGDSWIGTRERGYFFNIKPDGRVIKVSFSHLFQEGKAPRVRSLVNDPDGIWVGCTENTLLYYEIKTGKFIKWILSFSDTEGNKRYPDIHNILKDNEGIIISGNGIYRFDPLLNKLYQKYMNANSFNFTFIKDKNSGYWAGIQQNSVVRFDAELKETNRYRIGRDLNLIEHVCPGDSNDVWVAIQGGGLGHIYHDTGKYESFTTANGLSNNTVYSILKDKRGNLWISTNQGISMFNPGTRQFRNFGINEGLQIEEFDSDACFLAPDGEMFFGGVGGLVSFYPDSIYNSRTTPVPAPLVITEFRVSGKARTFDRAVYDLDSLSLQKGDNNFQVTFSCIDFAFADKIRYRYRLSGADTSWVQADFRNRRINYTNLQPGNYLLELEATNPEGEWVSREVLFIRIPFHYYETAWFKWLFFLFILSFLSSMVVIYVRQIRLKALQKQDELTLESIRGQMNPHFIYNSLNSINYFILHNDKFHANQYIADFSRLIRSILSNLTEEFIPFGQELQSIRDYLKLEHLRFGDKFEYFVECRPDEEGNEFWIMPGMVQTFIENAIWHGIRNLEGKKGFIKIVFTHPESRGCIRCTIEDTGVGRKLSLHYRNDLPGKKSRGMGIVSERLKLVNKMRGTDYRITVEDIFPEKEETGTRVTIDLPVKV